MRVYFDHRGRVRGYSMSSWGALLFYLVVGSVVFAVVVLPFLWPLVVFHGALAVIVTVVWNLVLVAILLAVRRAWRRVGG